jgi:hypothetical protein
MSSIIPEGNNLIFEENEFTLKKCERSILNIIE